MVALTVQLAAQAGAERGDAMQKALGAVPPRYKAVREALFALAVLTLDLDAARFVPDPGGFTADYAESSDWLAAVHELNPGVAAAMLARWAGVHRLKRNLWRYLAKRGLHVPMVGPTSMATTKKHGRAAR